MMIRLVMKTMTMIRRGEVCVSEVVSVIRGRCVKFTGITVYEEN